ncbi:probable F420-dependent oxidoreductase, Rv2161c family [Saccharopolyspora kobensis]|uniref:Probable F420-dependent oxidoreductase, Rv2161c family n=1 Tax=Saccharopolyspora kobensis TaxID=146035 RepID=A0A1H6E634_9PSEU|nr:LLM class F420-dependent oxidoreductase [Saccharopolyspora kobensis]SEG93238.1 probable F420-dependent oxidoreductase, Rv2161c family [Saccharopolyspora kobensis]SFD43774.1 probable F420-dependent oxidoreductase, Rv2161c family [Saccharopolyspora kobensis]
MQFGVAAFITDESIGPAVLGRALEARNFDALFAADHTHIPVSRETPYPLGGDLPRSCYRMLDPFVALTAAAAVTERLLVGTGICLVVQRDPITTAKEVASLDLVSGGRFLFGVGTGWNREEMRNHGTDPATRGALMDERIRAMREIWTREEAEFHGSHVDFDPISAWPKPVQEPHPPIYVGGESERSIARVAEYGGGWLPRAAAENLTELVPRVRDRAGRRVPVSVYGAPPDPAVVESYAAAGIDRALFLLPDLGRDEALRELDELAEFAARLR